MVTGRIYLLNLISLLLISLAGISQHTKTADVMEQAFLHPPASAKPWVFWYWMHSAFSKEGITADLEAMKEVGIGGAYLMPIKDTTSAIPFQPTVRQLTPEWWALVKFAMQEAKRLGLQLGMHVSDGFALAGGPWITPELSMQKLVWTKKIVKAGDTKQINLPQPEAKENFYKDVAVFAYPLTMDMSAATLIPEVTTSNGSNANFLADRNGKGSFRSDTNCWIQYSYAKPFTCRSVTIHVGGNNYQAQRLIVQASNDGINFNTVTRLECPRHGWQDTDEDYTHAIPATTAKYFRFVYDKEGSEPGSEDLDAAKWKPSFKVNGIYLSAEPVIHQYEAKNGSMWRVAAATTGQQVTAKDAVPLKSIIDLTAKMDKDGNLDWTVPSGNWMIVRIGHTSTGHTNYTGGAGLGLECDKFNATAVKMQFDNWFAKAFEKTDPALAKEVLKIFHVDSWECGSQNWSDNFRAEFKKRRGYDLQPYLLTMAGVPVESAETSEKILYDVRQTIAELVNDVFYTTVTRLAHEKGCSFSAEAIAPTMVSDGLLHYKHTDLPMGEFWLNSPTHDKPNDMLDAVSGAHIYGKNIIQAESFTSVLMNWGEHPGNMKALGDRNFALGINKTVIHVFTHNPWMDKKPGMTLGSTGLYFQRDQTWFKQSKAWIEYLTRCQALLQMGKPVVDIAVFTGEEVPRRAVLPDRLVSTLPGIFGKERVEAEKKRLANVGQPLRQIPDGVTHSANMADPEDWVDPLNGYAYDSFNPDALMRMKVVNGRVMTPGGASYKILIIPFEQKMNPASRISLASLKKIVELVKSGATVLMGSVYRKSLAAAGYKANQPVKGKLIFTPYPESSFARLGLAKDVEVMENRGPVAWTHRKQGETDIYFISNQGDSAKFITLSFRVNKTPEIWNPVTGAFHKTDWQIKKGRTVVYERFDRNQSLFIVFRKPVMKETNTLKRVEVSISGFKDMWKAEFDTKYCGPVSPVIFDSLKSWTDNSNPAVKYYSGTVIYRNTFTWDSGGRFKKAMITFAKIADIVTVKVNGINCGTLWTHPYWLNITKALKNGENKIEIEVANTWHNRLIGDQLLPADKRVAWTTAPFRLKDKPLLPAGIFGVKLEFRTD